MHEMGLENAAWTGNHPCVKDVLGVVCCLLDAYQADLLCTLHLPETMIILVSEKPFDLGDHFH